MASVSPNKGAIFALAVLMSLFVAGTGSAERGGRGGSSDRSSGGGRGTALPLGCWIASDGFVHNTNFATGAEEISKPFCSAADGKGITVIKPICKPASPPWSNKYQFMKGVAAFDCPSGQVCDQGLCKVKPKPVGCYDSDAPGKSDTSTWGGWLDKYNPQMKTPGFVKMENISSAPPDFKGDRCKDDAFMYEQICTDAAPSSNFQQARKEVAVKCPKGYWCKDAPITDASLVFGNPGAKGDGSPAAAAACVPKPDPCEVPWNDMCPEIDGCQMDPGECPPSKDICDSTLTKEQLQAKYGPDTSIFPMMGGGWVADSCVTTFTIKHEWCENGTPKSGISPCVNPDTCDKGMCSGKQISLPDKNKAIPDCEDTDIKGATNSFGKVDLFGQIKLKGQVATAANDACLTPKMVKQFKCDAAKPEGFSGNPFTCTGKNDCCGGICFTPVEAKCEVYDSLLGSGVKGTSKMGKPFDVTAACTPQGQIAKAVCDITGCFGYKLKDPEYCPDGKVCQNGACMDKPPQKTCGPLAGGNGVGVTENGKLTEYKNTCSGMFFTTWECDASGNAVSKIKSCALGCNPAGLCESCKDDDIPDNPSLLGTVQFLENGQTLSDKDFCDSFDQLVQVQCVNDSKGYTQPAPCPAGQICDSGVCIPKPQCTIDANCADADLCTQEACTSGKCGTKSTTPVPADTACEKFSCDPKTGKIVSTPQNLCPAGQVCDNNKQCKSSDLCIGKQTDDGNNCTIDACKDGSVTHTPKCTAPTTCKPATGICEPPKPDTGKGVGQACTQDSECADKDICNGGEKCVANKCAAGTPPVEGAGGETDSACFDDDKDGIFNGKDSCPNLYNPDQADANKDGKGDVCECALNNFTQIATGHSNTCALQKDGGVQCWGHNDYGQLGDGTKNNSSLPIAINLKDVAQIAAGGTHTCALLKDGGVQCWGNNGYGQLGDGTKNNSSLPIAINLKDVAQIAAGGQHTCALQKDGGVQCWGNNDYGQLGDGSTKNSPYPIAVGLKDVAQIAAGGYHSCALLKDGGVQCWGYNQFGQLGDGSKKGSPYPIAVGLKDVAQIATGNVHTCALQKDGGVQCWGSNGFGQLGNGSTENSLLPVAINLKDVAQVATGYYHTCALQKDGGVQCWGENTSGQLGNGSNKYSLLPVAINLKDVTQIATGGIHTCALLKDGGVQCWGDNDSGQLGNGSKKSSSVPVAVMDPACLFGSPSCVAKDPYGSKMGCTGLQGQLICDLYGMANCGPQKSPSNPDYKASCPTPASPEDTPKCVKIPVCGNSLVEVGEECDAGLKNGSWVLATCTSECKKINYGTPTCLVKDLYGNPGCSGGNYQYTTKTICDPDGQISCSNLYQYSSPPYSPKKCDAGDTPACSKTGQ